MQVEEICPECRGKKWTEVEGKTKSCETCHGKGYIRSEKPDHCFFDPTELRK